VSDVTKREFVATYVATHKDEYRARALMADGWLDAAAALELADELADAAEYEWAEHCAEQQRVAAQLMLPEPEDGVVVAA